MTKFIFIFLVVVHTLGAANLQTTSPGVVRFVVRTDPSWDQYTRDPSPQMRSWFRSKIWRMMVYSPYWNSRLSWFPNAWVYLDLYGVHVGDAFAKKHPDQLLTDEAGNPLYIPWGCGNGVCPQYAGNIADPNFRRSWLDAAREDRKVGYRGIFIDDVNLEYQVTDGAQKHEPVFDPRTKKEMTYDDWKKGMADFTEEIRKALPNMEIVHNAIWFAGGKDRINDPSVQQEIASADYINLERGATDSGLRGGNGEWSLNAFLNYIDGVHKIGRGILLDNMPGQTEYALCVYFLISSGVDGFGDQGLRPDKWWPGLDVDMGNPLGPREAWHGLIRRRYSRGVVIVNPPDSPVAHLSLSAQFRRAAGAQAGPSIAVKPAGGVVLIGPVDQGKTLDGSISVTR